MGVDDQDSQRAFKATHRVSCHVAVAVQAAPAVATGAHCSWPSCGIIDPVNVKPARRAAARPGHRSRPARAQGRLVAGGARGGAANQRRTGASHQTQHSPRQCHRSPSARGADDAREDSASHLSSIGFGLTMPTLTEDCRACRSDRPDAAWPGRYAGRDHRDPGDGGARRAERAGHRSCDRRCTHNGSMVGTYISLVYLGSRPRRWPADRWFGAGACGCRSCRSCCARWLGAGLVATLPALAISALVLGLVTARSRRRPAICWRARRTRPDRIDVLRQADRRAGRRGAAGILVPALTVWLGWKAALGAVAVLCLACAAAVQPLRAVLDHDRDRGALHGSALLSGVRLVGASGPLRSMAALSFVYSGLQNCTSSFIVPTGRGTRLWLDRAGIA